MVELDFLAGSSLFSSLIACYFFLGGAVAEAVAGGLVKKGVVVSRLSEDAMISARIVSCLQVT